MSMNPNPNDPFEQPQPAVGQPQGPPPKRGGKGCLIGCGVASILALFLCCGGGIVMTRFGVGIVGEEYERQLAGDPVIQENIGEIESMQWSFTGTFQEAQRAEGEGGKTALVFNVNGSKDEGQLIIVQAPGGDGLTMESATLVTSDGTRIPIDVGFSQPDEDTEIDLEDLIDEGDLNLDFGGDNGQPADGGESPQQ